LPGAAADAGRENHSHRSRHGSAPAEPDFDASSPLLYRLS